MKQPILGNNDNNWMSPMNSNNHNNGNININPYAYKENSKEKNAESRTAWLEEKLVDNEKNLIGGTEKHFLLSKWGIIAEI